MQGCRPQWLLKRLCSAHTQPLTPGLRYFSSTPHHGAAAETYDVVCVGGGPAGLSLLTGLRASPITSGLKVALVEGLDLSKTRHLNASPTAYSNRCSSLTPSSVDRLQEIGAWQHINHDRVQSYQEMEVWDGVTNSRISFDWASATNPILPQPAPRGGTIAYMIENLNLTKALQVRLSELGGASIFSPVRVESIENGPQSDDGLDLSTWPTLALSNGQRLSARLLVGADGANSPVRTFANIVSRGWDYNRHGVVATLQLSGPGRGSNHHKIAYQRFLPTGPIALLPLTGNIASLVWSTTPERAAALKKLSPPDFTAMVNAGFRLSSVDLTYLHTLESGQADEVSWRTKHSPVPDESKIPLDVVSVQEGSVASFPLRMRHADTYTAPRVALVGDAAHTIHPLAGQGLNQGQADVASLVRTIEDAVESGQDIGSELALERYNGERYAANSTLLGICDKLHKLYSFDSGLVVAARSLGLRAVDGLGFVKEFLMRRAAGA